MSPRRNLLAELFEANEAETPYGGRSVTYAPMGTAWLKVGQVRRRDRSEAGGSIEIESLTAEARSDARLSAGRVLRFGGGDWRIRSGEVVGGRSILNLERRP
ncbi:phage head-tail adapter protein [Brevundimonas sp. GCM10030266]|uniref:phage head-tail adapter protein n=1 Tax=Brevundimonas sp. GCM10030266 TaxID=3273386 RepID=UPI00361C5B56